MDCGSQFSSRQHVRTRLDKVRSLRSSSISIKSVSDELATRTLRTSSKEEDTEIKETAQTCMLCFWARSSSIFSLVNGTLPCMRKF